jgi:uncharacterized protein
MVNWVEVSWGLLKDLDGERSNVVIATKINIPVGGLEALCQKWSVQELSLFGSVLRDDFRPESDVDVLVSFEDSAPWSLWDLIAMREELCALFGRRVDLVEREGLRNPVRRRRILQTRQRIYVSRQR